MGSKNQKRITSDVLTKTPVRILSSSNEQSANHSNYRRRNQTTSLVKNCNCLLVLAGLALTVCLILSIIVPLIINITTSKSNASSTNTMTELNSTTMSTPMTISYRGLYVDGFDSILGNTSEENSLLNWCVSNHFNAISVYDLNQIMSQPARLVQLAQFLGKTRNTFGIQQIAAVRGSSANFLQNAQYDSSQTNLNERFSVYNLENEWWNNGPSCDFSCYTSILQTMDITGKNQTPSMTRELYIGWFMNPTGQELEQANTLVSFLDRIMAHDYQTSPHISYMTSRLSFLGQAAKNQSRIMDVIVIFSAEPTFMGDYFNLTSQNSSFEDAYINIYNQFNATTFPYKDYLQLIGYQIFRL